MRPLTGAVQSGDSIVASYSLHKVTGRRWFNHMPPTGTRVKQHVLRESAVSHTHLKTDGLIEAAQLQNPREVGTLRVSIHELSNLNLIPYQTRVTTADFITVTDRLLEYRHGTRNVEKRQNKS